MPQTDLVAERLGPPDHLCPKCGAYVMCDNDAEIERLTAEKQKDWDDYVERSAKLVIERDRLAAELETANESIAILQKSVNDALAGGAGETKDKPASVSICPMCRQEVRCETCEGRGWLPSKDTVIGIQCPDCTAKDGGR